MGAAGSKEGNSDPGIITVVPAAAPGTGRQLSSGRGPSPLPHTGPHSSRPSSKLSNRSDTPGATDPLLLHLKDLKAQGAKLDPALFAAVGRTPTTSSTSTKQRSTPAAPLAAAAASADPDSLLADLAVAQQLSSDSATLNAAITALVTDYQSWHSQHITALTQNQDYITRTMDQAESKANKAVRQVQQQTIKLKQLSVGLSKAAQLPALLQQLTAATEALEIQLGQLEQRADAVSAAAGAGAANASVAALMPPAAAAAAAGSDAPAASSRGVVGAAGAALSRTSGSSGSGNGRTGSLRSWLGVGTGGANQQQQHAPQPPPQAQQQQQQQAPHQTQQGQQQPRSKARQQEQ